MRKILIIWATIMLYASTAHAAAPSRAVLTFEGQEGIWFQRDVAEQLLKDTKSCKIASELDALYTQKIKLLGEELNSLRRLRELAEEGEMHATDALDRAIYARQAAERSRDSWVRSPPVWFTVGALVVAVVAVSVAVQR